MSRSYATRQLVTAALAANALHPLRTRRTAISSFAAGWLTTELAPQLLALIAADTAGELIWRRPNGGASKLGLALAAGSTVALGTIVAGARATAGEIEGSLARELGRSYLDRVESDDDAAARLVGWREWVRPFRMANPDVEVLRDIPYTEGGRRARLDIYRPRGVDVTDAPVLVQVHGGGWTIGTKEQQGLILMNRMAARGWVCVAMNYRLAPKHPFPAQIIDVKKAIAWTREHIGEYGGDPSYLVITGGSAGGHLAALAALTPGDPAYQPGFEDADTSVAGCVPFYGVYDMAGLTGERHAEQMRDHFLGPRIFRKDPVEHRDEFVAASPLARVNADAPDFLVLHGANDTLVDVGQARAFVAALREASKATVTYHELRGTQHAFEVFSSIRSQHTIRAVQRWLEWHHEEWEKRR
ncbi:MAG TPA: alpha/beta hydrolase [Marmoricola sp.]|nr:alpha/beta hydrolase [Marmoricola sp.]